MDEKDFSRLIKLVGSTSRTAGLLGITTGELRDFRSGKVKIPEDLAERATRLTEVMERLDDPVSISENSRPDDSFC